MVRNVGLGPRENSSPTRVHITGSTEARERVHLLRTREVGTKQRLGNTSHSWVEVTEVPANRTENPGLHYNGLLFLHVH